MKIGNRAILIGDKPDNNNQENEKRSTIVNCWQIEGEGKVEVRREVRIEAPDNQYPYWIKTERRRKYLAEQIVWQEISQLSIKTLLITDTMGVIDRNEGRERQNCLYFVAFMRNLGPSPWSQSPWRVVYIHPMSWWPVTAAAPSSSNSVNWQNFNSSLIELYT